MLCDLVETGQVFRVIKGVAVVFCVLVCYNNNSGSIYASSTGQTQGWLKSESTL